MLLIDPDRAISSVRQDSAPFPYVLKDFRGQARVASLFLARSGSLDRLLPLLIGEIAGFGEMARIASWRPASILDDAARWMECGAIQVAERVPDTPRLLFWTNQPTVRDLPDRVRFARKEVAAEFLRRRLADPHAREAIDAAVAARSDTDHQPPADESGFQTWLANQLMIRRLGLFPVNGDISSLRLCWITEPTLARIEPATAPAAPPQAQAMARIIQTMLSTMPDLPAELTPQAQTLIKAAADGTPFCEECAKAAAAARVNA
jgi:hypothetical protein